MNVYNEILNLFINNGYYYDFRNEVFLIGDKVFATDNVALIAMSKDKINTEGIYSPKKDVLEGVYPMKKEFKQVISFSQLSEMMKLVPIIDEVIEKYETTKCNECDGSGEVTYLYVSKSGEEYTSEYECPVCKGDGEVGETIKISTGRKIPDPNKTCNIKGSVFYIKQISRLYEVMKILGNKDIVLCYASPYNAHLFSVEDIEIIVMPIVRSSYDDPVCFSID